MLFIKVCVGKPAGPGGIGLELLALVSIPIYLLVHIWFWVPVVSANSMRLWHTVSWALLGLSCLLFLPKGDVAGLLEDAFASS